MGGYKRIFFQVLVLFLQGGSAHSYPVFKFLINFSKLLMQAFDFHIFLRKDITLQSHLLLLRLYFLTQRKDLDIPQFLATGVAYRINEKNRYQENSDAG